MGKLQLQSLPSDVIMAHLLPCLEANQIKDVVSLFEEATKKQKQKETNKEDKQTKKETNVLLLDLTRVGYTHTCKMNEPVEKDVQQWFQENGLHLFEYRYIQCINISCHVHLHNGLLHRKGEFPALRISRIFSRALSYYQPVYVDDLFYCQYGLLHNEVEPAHVCICDYTNIVCQEWYHQGKRHQPDSTKPAIINEAILRFGIDFDIKRVDINDLRFHFIQVDNQDDHLNWKQSFTAYYQHGQLINN